MKEKKTAQMKQWESYMLKMQDIHFFGIIRAYTGAIKTPFNKHDLLDRLISFLKQKEIQESIVDALSYDDINLLTAVYYLKTPSMNTLISYSYPESSKKTFSQVINLQERLLIYRVDCAQSSDVSKVYSINPVLQEVLLPYLNLPFLIPYEEKTERIADNSLLPPVFFSILYSYIYHNPDLFKKDGELKKKVFTNLLTLCPVLNEEPYVIHDIICRITQLQMLERHENEGLLIESQWKEFAKLTHLAKLIYLTIGASFYRNVSIEKVNPADILNELLFTLERGAWYLDKDVYSLFYLIYKKHKSKISDAIPAESIYARDEDCFHCKETFKWDIDRISIAMIHQAVQFKLLIRHNNLMAVNEAIFDIVEDEKPLLISNTYEVTVNQNAKLSCMLPLLPSLRAKQLLTFASFDFDRITCEKLFQKSLNSEQIVALFEATSPHSIPQNVRGSIQQWYESYSLINLYFGYVLCVDKKKRFLFTKDAPLETLVKKEIAEGVYLLHAKNTQEIDAILKKFGVDFISFVENIEFEKYEATYSSLSQTQPTLGAKKKQTLKTDIAKREKAYTQKQKEFLTLLTNSSFEKDVRDVLFDRIQRRLILSQTQVTPESLNNLPKKAEGMDFLGKVKLLEEAKANGSLVEIVMNDGASLTGHVRNLRRGLPGIQSVEIYYTTNTATYCILEISKIQRLKIVMESIFS